MKIIKLSKEGSLKLKKQQNFLFASDCDDLGRSFLPGEWVVLHDEKNSLHYLGFINLGVAENSPIIHVLERTVSLDVENRNECEAGENYLLKVLKEAIQKRKIYKDYDKGCRLVYGFADGLPGLIVELYDEWILIQINTAGLDRFRQQIVDFFMASFPDHKPILYDQEKYRGIEALPHYPVEIPFMELKVEENGIKYCLQKNKLQKIGIYYDHRRNRERFATVLQQYNHSLQQGLDLFCYAGSWGAHLLKAGLTNVTFVDQGDLDFEVNWMLKAQNWENHGHFVRDNVYHYLNDCQEKGTFFDVICSDPPAFTKSARQRAEALNGYRRLHELIFKVINDKGVVAICSCSHYISLEDLDETVQEAAIKANKKVFLLDTGLQGWDHPIGSLKDKGYYLKYLAYRVENRDQ